MITTEIVKEEFSKRGATLISDYENAHKPLTFICSNPSCNNTYTISWMNFRAGFNPKLLCKECNHHCQDNAYSRRKYTIEYFQEKFKEKGATLLTTSYQNPKTILYFLCSKCGNKAKIKAYDFIQGYNKNLLCENCHPNIKSNVKEREYYNIPKIRKLFAERGAELVSEEYIDYKTNLQFICSTPGCGRIAEISMSHFVQGNNAKMLCHECNPKRVGDKKKRYQEIKELFDAKGAILLTTEYKSVSQNFEFICSTPGCGNKHHIRLSHFLNGINPNLLCADCAKGNFLNPNGFNSGKKNRSIAESKWEEYIREFYNVDNSDVAYASHHIHPVISYPEESTSLTNGFPLPRSIHRPGFSLNGISNPFHKDSKLLLLSNFPDIAKLPYHSYEGFKFLDLAKVLKTEIIIGDQDDKYKLLNEKEASEELYIPIYYEELFVKRKRKIIFSMVRARLSKWYPEIYKFTGQKYKKYFARNLRIKEITYQECEDFMDENHIQGAVGAKVYLGLFDKDNLISLMTFGRPRTNAKYEWELIRFCNLIETIVAGGASKLFKYFIDKYKPISIISYCDKRFAAKDPLETVYSKLGMKYMGSSEPNYRWYYEPLTRSFNRMQFQKHLLKDKLQNYDPNLSEDQNMRNNGYKKLYDCGNFVFVWRTE